MIVKKFEIIQFKINLKRSFINSYVRDNDSEGFVVGFKDRLVNTAYGEISPIAVADIFINAVAEDLYRITGAKKAFDEGFYPCVFKNINKQK